MVRERRRGQEGARAARAARETRPTFSPLLFAAFHHQFAYPWSSSGAWLSAVDLCLATVAIAHANLFCTEAVLGALSPFDYLLMLGFVHEMNCADHSGCMLPYWSGMPFCPPAGRALGWDQSIAQHEAHHNYSRFSYGLLGAADALFGTARYPPGYVPPAKRRDTEGGARAAAEAKEL
jgi:sterol desaturase/sphingolipid hydroxylase (fatty acid hydroxylase superfamily)